MKILAIETSCDETGAAVVERQGDSITVHSNVIATSMHIHAQTGGIIPEAAARNQIQYVVPVIAEALDKAGISFTKTTAPDIDAIAITYGPGLIGSLLVGVETIRTLSFLWNKPLIPVNHLFGHIYANWIKDTIQRTTQDTLSPLFPLIALIVSGGHTDLLLMKSHTDITWLGGTRDDAAGEAFDKIGRLLQLPYPAGPKIEELAKVGDPKTFHFPRPLLHDAEYDFSFSGLKTAVLREVTKLQKDKQLEPQLIADICRGVQDAITDVLVTKTLKAAEAYNVKSILLSGGVSANETLRNSFREILNTKYHMQNIKLFVPQKSFCTDNAAMIGAAACFRSEGVDWHHVAANPELYFD